MGDHTKLYYPHRSSPILLFPKSILSSRPGNHYVHTAVTADKESIVWLRDYLSDTLNCRRRFAELDAQKGEYYGGWFEEKDWIGWQKHMENLISRLDELIAQPEQEIEFIKTQTMKENGITM